MVNFLEILGRNVAKGQSLCHPHKNEGANGALIHQIKFSPT